MLLYLRGFCDLDTEHRGVIKLHHVIMIFMHLPISLHCEVIIFLISYFAFWKQVTEASLSWGERNLVFLAWRGASLYVLLKFFCKGNMSLILCICLYLLTHVLYHCELVLVYFIPWLSRSAGLVFCIVIPPCGPLGALEVSACVLLIALILLIFELLPDFLVRLKVFPGSSCVFLASAMESAISPRGPGSFYLHSLFRCIFCTSYFTF